MDRSPPKYDFNSNKSSYLSFDVSNQSSEYWEAVAMKAEIYLDSINIHKGDPTMKKEQFFAKNRLSLYNIRKSSLEEKITLFFPKNIKKKKSCIEFEKEGDANDQNSALSPNEEIFE